MSEVFKDLSWTESTLENLTVSKDEISFDMLDLVARSPLTYELVKISIKEIVNFSVKLSPHVGGRFFEPDHTVTHGNQESFSHVFEGVMGKTNLVSTNGDGFWVTGEFTARHVEVARTGTFRRA